jgi:hypothetical protein
MSLAVVDWPSLGICTVIWLPLLSFFCRNDSVANCVAHGSHLSAALLPAQAAQITQEYLEVQLALDAA